MDIEIANRQQLEEQLEAADADKLQEMIALLENKEEAWDIWCLSSVRYLMFLRTMTDPDLNFAINAAYRILSLDGRDTEMVHQVSAKVSNLFMTKFQRTNSKEDLACALFWLQYSINSMPSRHELLLSRHHLFVSILEKYESVLHLAEEDLYNPSYPESSRRHLEQYPHKVAEDARKGIVCILTSHGKAWLSFAFAIIKGCCAQSFRNVDDITRCVRYLEKAFDGFQEADAKVLCLDKISMMLNHRYEATNDINDAKKAVYFAEQVMETLPAEKDGSRALHLHNLAVKLRTLYTVTREREHLEKAIPIAEEAVILLPPNSQKILKYETESAACLAQMYLCLGDMKYLDKGIEKCDEIGHLAEEKSDYAQEYWNVLTGLVRFRYDRMQVKEDIHRAVDTARKSVERTLPHHPDITTRVHNLATVLWLRFDREGAEEDLDEAIQCATCAEQGTPDQSHFMATILSTLSGLLVARYQHRQNADDLDSAVLFARKAINLSRPEKLEYLTNRNNLARILLIRSLSPALQVDSLSNVAEGVDLFKSVVDQTLSTDGRLPSRLRNLGNAYFEKFKITGSVEDLEESVRALSKCAYNPVASPSLRIEAARKAADILILQSNFVEADVLLQLAVSLLQRVSPRSLQQQDAISKFSGMTTLAASIAIQAGATAEKALELLEEGRGIILGLLFDVRSDISALRSQYPALAARFEHLRDSLESPAAQANIEGLHPSTNVSLDFTYRNNIVKQLDEIIAHIRKQKGFFHFLAPPSITDMQTIASAGPVVVINASEYRSDAFIVASSRLEHVHLPNLQLDAIKRWVTLLVSRNIAQPEMFELLRWLWDVLAQPILEALQRSGLISNRPSDKPRLWWIPSGPLCSLPIHAAGKYTKKSSCILMDKVISSYSPSIKAMIFSQRNAMNTYSRSSLHRSLIVSMGTTPGVSDLPFANEEGQVVRNELSKLSTIQQLPEVQLKPNKATFIADMSRATILHFAGHGLSDPKDPLDSTLLVEDWQQDPLTVKDLLSLRLHQKPPFIAYLSACSTGRSSVDHLIDESLHLMSACLLVGFQHVIGSLWEVSDKHSAELAQRVFATMVDAGLSHECVSICLQDSLKPLRDSKNFGGFRDGFGASQRDVGEHWHGGDPRIWAAYIHMGL
jgi:CHAT domain-containing protein/tetratricopeptide (TPR) repeat protein